MKKHLITSIRMTVVLTAVLGIAYPLVVTGIAQLVAPDQANGELIYRGGALIGSRLLAQPFTGPTYFHPRPSAAGSNGYDAANSNATNLGPTNQKLIERVRASAEQLRAENSKQPVPVDLVTTSASGLDPDISPASAEFQVPRIARARGIDEQQLTQWVREHTTKRQLGFLGEPRVNVLRLNLLLEEQYPKK